MKEMLKGKLEIVEFFKKYFILIISACKDNTFS